MKVDGSSDQDFDSVKERDGEIVDRDGVDAAQVVASDHRRLIRNHHYQQHCTTALSKQNGISFGYSEDYRNQQQQTAAQCVCK